MIRPSLISKLADNGSAKENISPKRGGGLVHRSVLTLEHSEPGRRRLRDGILGLSTIPIEGAASMSQRPFSVIVVSWVYLAAGAFGMAFHLADLSLQAPFRYDTVWASLVPLLAILAGIYMLLGRSWARWLALAWMAYHVVLSGFHSWLELLVHSLLGAVFAYILFRPRAAKYFHSSRAHAV
ncbi:MAG TPA: hypothetical protein VLN58_15180 [Verrucomicrobiae bacterium]|nr:hypothetical protein [Verrucomicrobiae bacterium]